MEHVVDSKHKIDKKQQNCEYGCNNTTLIPSFEGTPTAMPNLPAATLVAALTLAASPGQAGQMTAAEPDARQAALNREAERAVAENDRLFREAEDVARRYSVDLTAYRDERVGLHRKRQDALRQGNHLRSSMFEVLLASNTGNALEEIFPHLPAGPEQQRYRQRVQQSRASLAAFKASLAPSGR